MAKSLEELKDGFADLWDSLGNVSFNLTWHNLSGCVTPPFDQDAREFICKLALPFTWPPDESEFTLGCDSLTLPKDEKFAEARSTFKGLSSEAGRRLPALDAGLQSYIGQLNDDPAAWWYAMLFQGHEKHVAYQQGNETQYHKSLSIWQPVKDSTDRNLLFSTRPSEYRGRMANCRGEGVRVGPCDQPPRTVPIVKLLFASPLGEPLHFVEA